MKTFIIPANGNSITEKDIEKNTLRITVDFKPFFPSQNATIELFVNNKWHHATYIIKEGRSSLLRVGKEVLDQLQLKPNQSVKFECIDTLRYKLTAF